MADPAASGYEPNAAQRRLAEEVTRFVHGEEGLEQARKATEVRCVCGGGVSEGGPFWRPQGGGGEGPGARGAGAGGWRSRPQR